MNGDPLAYRIAFASLRGMTPALAREILARCDSEERFFTLTASQLASMTGTRSKLFDSAYRDSLLEAAAKEADFITANSLRCLYFTDPDYPARLADCPDAPLMLFCAGGLDLNHGHFVGIVGTRHATPYGTNFTEKLVEDLTARLDTPPVIVSGLAFGIDIAAHRAALRAGAPTAAVLAHGLNTIYPGQHRATAADIVRSGGALITDYRSCDPIHKGNFIARNRIVAGLCDCVVVAESDIKGGALITAGLAGDYSRDVFALPGRTGDRFSRGCNRLIADNRAALITDAEELARAMAWKMTDPQQAQQQSLFQELSPEEQQVADYLATHDDAQINSISVALNMGIGRLTSTLVELEFRGIVLKLPGARYRLA